MRPSCPSCNRAKGERHHHRCANCEAENHVCPCGGSHWDEDLPAPCEDGFHFPAEGVRIGLRYEDPYGVERVAKARARYRPAGSTVRETVSRRAHEPWCEGIFRSDGDTWGCPCPWTVLTYDRVTDRDCYEAEFGAGAATGKVLELLLFLPGEGAGEVRRATSAEQGVLGFSTGGVQEVKR